MKRYPWQPDSREIPTEAGVYRFISDTSDGESVLYVGKAKNLRARLTSYFQDPNLLQYRTANMLSQATAVAWTLVNSEIEALQLEHTLIQKYKPRYNIRFRDDKSYPYICITIKDEVPRIFSSRRKSIPGARYFGPYPNPSEVRTAIDTLTKIFPIRSCAQGVFRNHKTQNRACLLGHIGKCMAPCTSTVSKADHKLMADALIKFLDGGHNEVLSQLTDDMNQASQNEKYEEAAKLRDKIAALNSILQKSVVNVETDLVADFIGIASTDLDLVVSIVQVRHGRVVGEERVTADLHAQTESKDIISEFILERYSNSTNVIKEIYISGIDFDTKALEETLVKLAERAIKIVIPQRGEKARIGELAVRNASAALTIQKNSVLSDLNSRSKALKDLATELKLPNPPLRIECIDVSHLQGTNRVAALVVFEDGLPARSEYRSFVLQEPGDDLAGIREVVTRRVKYLKETRNRYPLGLLVIDGGPWQALAAKEVLDQAGLDIPTVGLAKRLEEVWFPAGKSPIMLPRDSGALYLLQQLRDETHRRAISHHRKRRSRQAVASVLDEIEGIGPEKRKLLLRQFGGATGIRNAKIDELAAVKGIGPRLAKDIFAELHLNDENLPESGTKGV